MAVLPSGFSRRSKLRVEASSGQAAAAEADQVSAVGQAAADGDQAAAAEVKEDAQP